MNKTTLFNKYHTLRGHEGNKRRIRRSRSKWTTKKTVDPFININTLSIMFPYKLTNKKKLFMQRMKQYCILIEDVSQSLIEDVVLNNLHD